MSKSTEYRKNVFTRKNWTNKNDTNESWKAGALWWTICLSFAPYDELIFQFYFLLLYVKLCLMPIGLNLNWIPGPTVALVFHAFEHAFKVFSGLAFLNRWISLRYRWDYLQSLPLLSLTTVYLQVSPSPLPTIWLNIINIFLDILHIFMNH